ncbi:hypothetical protein [Sphingobium chungangianum]
MSDAAALPVFRKGGGVLASGEVHGDAGRRADMLRSYLLHGDRP